MARATLLVILLATLLLVPRSPEANPLLQAQEDRPMFGTVLDELAPGTTLHTVQREYRRHGPAESVIPKDASYLPEDFLIELWITFDSSGLVAEVRGETRGLGGNVYNRTVSDGRDVVFLDQDGLEVHRVPAYLGRVHVDTFRATMTSMYQRGISALDVASSIESVAVGTEEASILESRRPWSRDVSTAIGGANIEGRTILRYAIPYVGDIAPTEVVERRYMSERDSLEIRLELVAVNSLGIETLIERTEHILAEVTVQ